MKIYKYIQIFVLIKITITLKDVLKNEKHEYIKTVQI